MRRFLSWPGPARLAAAALSLAALPASGQGLPLELAVGVSRNGSPPAELSDDGCAADVGWAPEGRVSLRFSRAFRLEGTLGYHFEAGVRCDDPFAEPPPASGPFEQRAPSVPDAGYPFLTTDARVSWEPSQPAGEFWLRAFGGYGRIWGKDIGYWLAGGGLVFGGRLTTLLELEWNFLDIPFTERVRLYEDGVLVAETNEAGSISHTELRLRAGFRFRL